VTDRPAQTEDGKQRVLAVVFHGAEDVGRAGTILEDRGYALDIRFPLKGEMLPATADEHAGTIVFGGAMSANDTHLDGIRHTTDWLGRHGGGSHPIFGICLGAQMIALAGGGRVDLHPERRWEIGYFPVRETPRGRGFLGPEVTHLYQWHKEGFELPRGAELLASGEGFPNQAFRIGDKTFGVQFHAEAPPPLYATWMTANPGFETLRGAQDKAQQAQLAERHDGPTERWLADFLADWVAPARLAAGADVRAAG